MGSAITGNHALGDPSVAAQAPGTHTESGAPNAVVSTFDFAGEGWTMQGDAASVGWSQTGGHPGGCMKWVDAQSGNDCYWVAPAQFLGDKSAFYGGTLSYDVKDTGNDYHAKYDVYLSEGPLTIVATIGQPNTNWTHFSIKLNALSWHQYYMGTVSPDPETADQVKLVLEQVSDLRIRAEYVVGDESGGLDNVALVAPGTKAVSWSVYGDHDLLSAPTGAFGSLADALAAAASGDSIVLDDAAGTAQNFGQLVVDAENLQIDGSQLLDGTFVLGNAVSTFLLGGTTGADVTGNDLNNNITGSDGNNTINGGAGKDFLMGRSGNDHLSGGTGADVLEGEKGADVMAGGAGHDAFEYGGAADSTGAKFDTIDGIDFRNSDSTSDKLMLPASLKVTHVAAPVTGGKLSLASFDSDLAKAVGPAKLGAHQAVLFSPGAGDEKGKLFLIIDCNGKAGYQAGKDLVIALTHAHHAAELGGSDFTTI